jgi:CBS-domain-containing membrane protein
MVANRVSGLPVVDAEGHVVGVISDGDLILRQRRPKARPWWCLFFENSGRLIREYKKTAGLTVGEVMTRPAVVISPVFEIETAAAILDNRQIRRLPVVRDGYLVGVVSRGDLIRALAGPMPKGSTLNRTPDQNISGPTHSGAPEKGGRTSYRRRPRL